jgi:hypothetical protein
MARTAHRDPETTPPDGPPREPVDPTAVPDPKPIDDPRPGKPSKTAEGPLDREIERLIEIVETRLH